MTIRNRIKVTPYVGERTLKSNGAKSYDSYSVLSEQCSDEVAPGDNAPFSVERLQYSGGLISGSGFFYTWTGYPCLYMTDPYLTTHLTIPSTPSYGSLATSLLARTNPSRPSSAFLEYASEMHTFVPRIKDRMGNGIRNLFRTIKPGAFAALSRIARLNLLVQFGILPMISDIRLLTELQDRVDKRSLEIDRMRTRGLRRSIDLWKGSAITGPINAFVQSEGTSIHADIEKQTVATIRGHIRWYANASWLKSDQLVKAKLKQAILGYNLDPVTLYEIMPWSWFLDYFTNLGDMIKATRNMFDASHDAPRIMSHLRTESRSYRHTYSEEGDIIMSPIRVIHESKERILTSASLGARVEALTASQLSILGSLAILRG
nr:MAG: hypothetical protein 1 [Leviviridae sp.]